MCETEGLWVVIVRSSEISYCCGHGQILFYSQQNGSKQKIGLIWAKDWHHYFGTTKNCVIIFILNALWQIQIATFGTNEDSKLARIWLLNPAMFVNLFRTKLLCITSCKNFLHQTLHNFMQWSFVHNQINKTRRWGKNWFFYPKQMDSNDLT